MKIIKHGIVTGIFIGFILSIIFSFINSGVTYYPLAPNSTMGAYYYSHYNELQIMVICMIVWSLIGILFSMTNKIFTDTDWNITKQTSVHFVVTLLAFTPLAILAGWFTITIDNFIFFLFIFVIIYLSVWLSSYYQNKQTITKINNKLSK